MLIFKILITLYLQYVLYRSGGHWISSLNRLTTLYEIASLQGLPRSLLDRMKVTGQSDSLIGAAIGDAMSINVLMRLWPAVLDAAGLFPGVRDVWKESAHVSGMMPDSLYVQMGCLADLR